MTLQVGKNKLLYQDVVKDIDGWCKSSDYLPMSFDIVEMKTKDFTCNGWYDGYRWFGMKLRNKQDKQVLYWKRKLEFY